MALFIREILPPIMISDASVIPNFTLESEQDVLAIAKENILYIYQIGNIQDSSPAFYEFNNPIKLVRPIYSEFSTNSNILIIFTDFKACILGPNGESLLNFSIIHSTNVFNPMKIKCALHPNLIAIQISQHHIDMYSKTENCLLKYVTSISIGSKNIIDFCFIGPTTRVMQLAVLTEEFNDPPHLRIIDINSSDWTYKEDSQKNVKLSKDSYLLFPIHPEQLSTVVVLNSNQCLRITQKNDGLEMTSATICTADKIINCDHLHNDIFSYIDEAGNFGFVEINQEGTVHFESVGKSDKPFKIIALTHNLMLIASHDSLSKVIKLKKDNSTKTIRTFQIAGKIAKVVKDNNDLMAICDKGSINITPIEKVNIFEKINFNGGSRIFSYNNSIIVSKFGESFEIGSNGRINQESDFNCNEKIIFINEYVHCTENQLEISEKYKINDKFIFCEATQKYILYVNEANEVHLLSLSFKPMNENEKDAEKEKKLEEGHESTSNINCKKIGYYEIPFPNENNEFINSYKNAIAENKSKIIAISMNDFYIAILTSFITIYQISNLQVVNKIYSPDVISIKLYDTNQLISINSLDYINIYFINSFEEKKIFCKGSHTNICECNGFHVIGGSNPSILINNSIVQIDCEPFYDATFIRPNEFAILNFNGIQKIRLLEKGFRSKLSISSIPISSFARLNNDQYVYSRTMKDITYFFLNDNEEPFFSCENFVSIKNVKSLLNIICRNSVIVFDSNLKKKSETKFENEILNFIVNRSKRYIYQEKSIIDLETKGSIFNSNENQSISFVSINHKYTVFIIHEDTMVLYVVNDDNSYKFADMIPLHENISCLSLNGNIVLIGTRSCKILMMKINNDSKFERCNSINLLSSIPTSVDKSGNSFYFGLSTGSIIEIKIINIDSYYEQFLHILQNNMKCLAGLSKTDQYLSEEILFDNKKGILFDISNLARFASMKEPEQISILQNSFPLNEAREFVSKYNNLFLS